jgi:transposase
MLNSLNELANIKFRNRPMFRELDIDYNIVMDSKAFFLSDYDRDVLHDLHHSQREKRIADRIKCILYLDQGLTIEQAAQLLLISVRQVNRIKQLFMKQGIDGLLVLNFRGSQSKLTHAEENEIKDHLRGNLVQTSKELVHFIKKRYGKAYSEQGLVQTLKRWGFVYKKTRAVPSKCDPEAQRRFVEEYHALRESLEEGDRIYFMDGVHPVHNSKPCWAWIERGTEKQIQSNTGRKRVNLNGVYCPLDHEVIVREDDRINADSTIALLSELESRHKDAGLIFVFHDRARYYYNQKVWDWLENESEHIVLLALPTYSPNLNLIERLWKFLNKHVLRGKYYEKFDEFRRAVLAFLGEGLLSFTDELSRLMVERFQIIGHKT